MNKNNNIGNLKKLSLIIISIAYIMLFSSTVFSWWDGSWPYRQEINVTSPTTTNSNFQVEIFLNSSNVGTGFDWSNECSGNMSRLRFVNEFDNDTLDYWVKSCNSTAENMTVWVEIDNNITSSGYLTRMYYGNSLASLYSNANDTFDYYFNMSGLTIVPEGAGQDISGGGDILNSGRVFHGYGNSWKVLTDFGTWDVVNDGSQILELELRALDCGEIVALRFDTNDRQEGSNSYKWCGSQGYGTTPDVTYSGSGEWETVNSVLNDFTISATHIHLPVEDDGDASADAYFRDIRVRKYVATSPSINIGSEEVINTTVLSLSPENNFITPLTTINLSCSFATSNSSELKNVSLYGNWSGGWHINQTVNISGNLNSTNFTVNLPNVSASYEWNCLVYDVSGDFDFFDFNFTFYVDLQAPVITVYNPLGIVDDVTPTINISTSENSNLWYNIDGGLNISLCSNCNVSFDNFLHLAEGSYTINVFANDSVQNFNNESESFTIDLNNNFYDNFNDNSSIDDISSNIFNIGNITYSGSIEEYQGIQLGIVSTNMNFIANQWNGGSNAGEVDIECPGGDANCWFTTQNGTNITSIDIANGVTTLDSDSSTVGFVMYSQEDVHTRFSPPAFNLNGDNVIAVCYVSGQWYYEDNDGCDNPFTPVNTDVLLANLTWGITSVDRINASFGGNNEVVLKSINTTNNISIIDNITWSEGVNDANNYVDINLSFDNGATWFNVTNGLGLENFTESNTLLVKIIFESNGSIDPSIRDINITWSNNITGVPEVNITNPLNNVKFIGNYVNVSYNVSDNEAVLNCTIFINNIFNRSDSCNSSGINYVEYNFSRGLYNIVVQADDLENNSVNSSSVIFRIIDNYDARISKNVSSIGNDMFLVSTNVSSNYSNNLFYFDVVSLGFTAGSFTPNFNVSYLLNGPSYNGLLYYWNFTSVSDYNIFNYSVAGNNSNYKFGNLFNVGLD